MAESNGNSNGQGSQQLQIKGGAAIVAPVSQFQNGIPPNALIVVPVQKPTDEFTAMLEKGPVGVTPDQMWELLGFNGAAVQVQDDQGRPLMIGVEDLLSGLDKHFNEKPDDLNRGRIYAQELIKHNRLQRAEQVLSKIVAKGGTGDDWLALGISQLQQDKLDKAEGTLKGAANLLKTNAYPSLHLAKLYKQQENRAEERVYVEKAIECDPESIDAWAYLFQQIKETEDEDKAIAEMEKRATDAKSSRPFVAMQAFYSNSPETRDKAIDMAKRALDMNADDLLALLSLSALYGQKGQLDEVIKLLQPHEAKMMRDVRIANNYFEALFQSRQVDKVTKLLNALAGSQNAQVKQFAIERSKLVAQFLQQQQKELAAVQKRG